MDITEQYIKMCESAKEIQKSWSPDIGDWFLNDFRGTSGFSKDLEKQIWGDDKKEWEKIQCLTYRSSIKDYVTVSDSDGSHTYKADEFFKHRHVWLSRQDQLQKMLLEKFSTVGLIYAFTNFVHDNEYELVGMEELQCVDMSSFEQLWIAFVMNKLYDKRWNDSEWI